MTDLIERLLYEQEGTTLDFKEEQYEFVQKSHYEKSELLKDILAFANAWRREDSYILIGVKEVKGGKSLLVGIKEEEKLDDASLQQFVNEKTNKPINFEYKSIPIGDKIIGIIKIPLENNQRPFFLKKDFGKVKKNGVKIRRGSATVTADPDEIFKMSQDHSIGNSDPILELEFSDNTNKRVLGERIELESEIWSIVDRDDIPSYYVQDSYYDNHRLDFGTTNSSYYEELVDYYQYEKLFQPISFSLFNNSKILATDIKVNIVIKGNIIDIIKGKKFPKYPKASYNRFDHLRFINREMTHDDILIEERDGTWYIDLLFEKIQAKQRIYSNDILYLAVKEEATMDYQIYADNISTPIKGALSIQHKLNKKEMSYKDVLEYDSDISMKELEKLNKNALKN